MKNQFKLHTIRFRANQEHIEIAPSSPLPAARPRERVSWGGAPQTPVCTKPIGAKYSYILFWIICFTLLNFDFNKINAQPGLADPIYTGPYEEVSQNFVIRTFIFYVDNSNWTNNIDLSLLSKSYIDFLNIEFAQHGIQFIQYNSNNFCDGIFVNNLDFEIDTSQNFNLNKPDALNIWVKGGSGVSSGAAFGAPSNYLELNGGNGIPDEVLFHETGHCLGLIHTFGFQSIQCDSILDIDSCYQKCDLVCDTPFKENSGNINVDNTCTASIGQYFPPELFKNYMTYVVPGSCRDHFSVEQIKRMRYHLANHEVLQPMQVQGIVLPGDTINDVSGDIVIESGTHEIIDTLYMLPGAKIVVKKGARLNIYAPITAACGGMWEGIIVEGTPGGSQNISGSTNAQQGWVSLYGSGVIEHAKIGIRLETASGGYGGGGILYPCLGGFINCTTSIRLGAHLSASPNAAVVQGASFYLDEDYRGGSERPIFIDALYVTQLRVRSAWFKDDRPTECTGIDSRAIGIDAKASSINAISNSFENLGRGILITQTLIGAYVANNNSFTNCYRGIESVKCSRFSVSNNNFLIGAPPECPDNVDVIGLTLSGNAAGFTITKNEFTKNGAGNNIGTKIDNTLAGINNTIFENEYADLVIGNLAMGFNGDNNSGMAYVCNTHAGDDHDYIVDANATIWTEQKYVDDNDIDKATGNLFSGGTDKGSFNNGNGVDIQYFFAGSANDMNREHFSYDGANFSGVNGVIEDSNGDCTSALPCNPCPPESSANELRKESFFEKRQEWDARKEAITYMTDTLLIAAEEDTIRNIKQVMDRQASYVLQSFSQDTSGTELELDSILTWLEHAETYSGDLERASLYFFTGELDEFDTLWAEIPTTYDLDGDHLSEFNELGLVYELLRPTIEEEENLSQLAQPILDSLEFWKTWCAEPGFLAKSILWWNGIESVQDCEDPQKVAERHAASKNESPSIRTGEGIIVYPNPANNSLTVSFGNQFHSNFTVKLYNIQGINCFEQSQIRSTNEIILSVSELPAGLYFLKIMLEGQRPLLAKLSIIN